VLTNTRRLYRRGDVGYTSGRLLVAFGFDSLPLGQQRLFKGMRFASTDQASVITLGSLLDHRCQRQRPKDVSR
jgi:hypothetical protein